MFNHYHIIIITLVSFKWRIKIVFQPSLQVDDEGRVIVSGRLDREKQSVHKLAFLAETGTSPTLNAYYDLTVQVLDRNDGSPKFNADPYEVKVSEAVAVNTPIIQVSNSQNVFLWHWQRIQIMSLASLSVIA